MVLLDFFSLFCASSLSGLFFKFLSHVVAFFASLMTFCSLVIK